MPVMETLGAAAALGTEPAEAGGMDWETFHSYLPAASTGSLRFIIIAFLVKEENL